MSETIQARVIIDSSDCKGTTLWWWCEHRARNNLQGTEQVGNWRELGGLGEEACGGEQTNTGDGQRIGGEYGPKESLKQKKVIISLAFLWRGHIWAILFVKRLDAWFPKNQQGWNWPKSGWHVVTIMLHSGYGVLSVMCFFCTKDTFWKSDHYIFCQIANTRKWRAT